MKSRIWLLVALLAIALNCGIALADASEQEPTPLDAPVATLSEYELLPGRDLTVEIQAVEGARSYYIDIERQTEDGGWKYVYSGFVYPDERGEILPRTVDGYNLTVPGFYQADITAYPENSETHTYGRSSTSFVVLDGSLPAGPQITLESDTVFEGHTGYFSLSGGSYERCMYVITDADNINYGTDRRSEITPENRQRFYIYQLGNYMLRVRGYAGGRWTDLSEPVPFSVVKCPRLESPELEVSAQHTAGMDLDFSLVPVEGANEYEIQLVRKKGEEWETIDWTWLDSDELHDTFQGYLLSLGEYRIYVQAHPADWNSCDSSLRVYETVVVTGSQPEAPQLTLLNANETLIQGQRLTFAVDRPFEKCRYRIEDLEGQYGRTSDDTVGQQFSVELDRAGQYEVIVSGLSQGVWSQWSAPVSVEIISLGALDAPQVILSEMTAGRDSTFVIQADAAAEKCYWSLSRVMEGDDGYDYDYLFGENSPVDEAPCLIEGSYLEPGRYRLYVETMAEGYDGSSTEVSFEIEGTLAQGPVITVDNSAPMIGETVSFAVSASGMERCCYVIYALMDDGEAQHYGGYDEFGPRARWERSFDKPGEYAVRARVRFDGTWTDYGPPTVVSVSSLGQLDAPVFVRVPENVRPGEDLIVEVEPVAHAGGYEFALEGRGGSGKWYGTEYGGPFAVLRYEDMGFFPAGEYTLFCRVSRDDPVGEAEPYEDNESSVRIVVSGTQEQGPMPAFDAQEYTKDDTAVVTVQAPGAEGLALEYNGDYYEVFRYNYAADTYRIPIQLTYEGPLSVRASVKKDGVWTSLGPAASANVTSAGTLTAPVITMDDSFAFGDVVTLHVESDPRAEYYEVSIATSDGSYSASYTPRTPGNSDVSIPTGNVMLDRPGSYYAVVTSIGRGWNESSARHRFELTPRPGGEGPEVVCDNPDAIGEERAVFTVTAPGASLLKMYEDGSQVNVISLTDGMAAVPVIAPDWPCDYRFSACVDGIWSEWSAPVTLGGGVRRPKLGKPLLTLSEWQVEAGETLTLTVSGVENAEKGSVYVSGSSADAELEEPTKTTVLSIDTSEMEAGRHEIYVLLKADGYRSNAAEVYFYVTRPVVRGVPVAATADKIEVSYGETVTYTITAPSGTVSGLRFMDELGSIFTGEDAAFSGSTAICEWNNGENFSTSRDMPLLLKFSVKVDGVWSAFSDPVTVWFRCNSATPLEPHTESQFEFSLSGDAVYAGEPLTVEWEAVDGVTEYYVDWYGLDGGYAHQTVTGTWHVIDTSKLSPGVCGVIVFPRGYPGEVGARFFTVLRPVDVGAVLKLPESLVEIGEQAFSGMAPSKVLVPDGCASIGKRAFAGCSRLALVEIPASVRTIAADAFAGCTGFAIKTPVGSAAEAFARSHGIPVLH